MRVVSKGVAEAKDKRYFFLEVKASDVSDEGHGSVTGHGGVKNNVDYYGDEIQDGAFVDGLPALLKDGFMGESHKWDFASSIGTVGYAAEDESGLLARLDFYSTPDAQQVRQKVKERLERGKTVGLSIGYFATEWSTEDRDGKEVRLLKKVEVFEISVVTMPANTRALVATAKAGDRGSRADQFDNALGVMSDSLTRIDELKDVRGEKWQKARVLELEDLIAKASSLKDALGDSPTLDAKASPAVVSRALQMAGLPE